ncbi:uncharacterized protein [Drosophila tropicalis]|uniref:uncharacterized protein n=1 Tax=Drosophila tropicalis TaxID=46794 RepID=UPI0035AB91E3
MLQFKCPSGYTALRALYTIQPLQRHVICYHFKSVSFEIPIPTPVPAQPSSHNIVRTYFTSEARSSRDKLLGTAIVDFWHKGTTYASRALLDTASEANFISERMFRLMKLPFQTVRAEVTGINGKVNRTLKVCHISIRSSHGPPVQIEIEAFVLSQVADDLPSCTIAQATLDGMPNIPLADPSFRLKAKIDLLLGIDGSRDEIREEGLETLLTRFLEVEDLPGKPVEDSDSVCEVNFQKTAGWLAPFVIQAKVFMQELWLQELGSEFHDGFFMTQIPTSNSIVFAMRHSGSGATLLAELAAAVLPQLPVDNAEAFYWSDSTVVLSWLKRPPCTWTTFVANRVAKIVTATNDAPWNHVRSEDNPADLPSRGLSAQELVHKDLWWHGPPWLREPQESWQRATPLPLDTTLEKRVVKVHVAIAKPAIEILSRFSNLARALRVIAYVIRFGRRCRKLPNDYSGEVTSSEINQVLQALIRVTQRNYFPTEHRCLQQKKSLPTSSTILNLNPFIDASGVIRA